MIMYLNTLLDIKIYKDMTHIPTFITERLILRTVEDADIPAYKKYFIDYDVIRHLTASIPWPYPENGVEEYLTNHVRPFLGVDKWLWGISFKKAPNKMIGAIELWRQGSPEHRGFWLGKPFWGQGYMTEAVQPINDYAFDHLGFEVLRFSNAVGNYRSRRVKEKTGAKLLYTKPKKFVSSEYTEHEIWELTKEEWKRHK